MSCSICDNKLPPTRVICAKCEGTSCRPCFQTYLLNSPLTANCMHCRTPVSDDFVLDNTTLTWRTKEYRPYKENLLLDIEKARLPDTQQYASAVVTARNIKKELSLEVDRLKDALRVASGDKKKIPLREKIAELRETIHIANNSEFQNMYNPARVGIQVEKIKRPMVKACPAETCRGFLSEDFDCPMCSTKVCKKCHETILAEEHTCNPETVESVKAIMAEARPCPSCAAVISKIDGCDQMWCTQCQTTFSWRTGMKEEGHTHNPHYYEFMRRNGGMPRAPGDNPGQAQCGMPNLESLMAKFSPNTRRNYQGLVNGWRNFHERQWYLSENKEWPPPWHTENNRNITCIEPWPKPEDIKKPLASETAYLVALTVFHRNALHLNNKCRGLRTNPPDNHTLRVKFMIGEFDDASFRVTLQRRDKAHRKAVAVRHIYEMAYATTSDIFREFVNNSDTTLKDLHKPYSQVLEIFTYANNCFSRLEKSYASTVENYTVNPFQTSRWM